MRKQIKMHLWQTSIPFRNIYVLKLALPLRLRLFEELWIGSNIELILTENLLTSPHK